MQFFSPEEVPTARALVNRLLAQDEEPRVPAVELIDAKLAARQGDGYRHRDMPEDWAAIRGRVGRRWPPGQRETVLGPEPPGTKERDRARTGLGWGLVRHAV
jgi:hypothetical protein